MAKKGSKRKLQGQMRELLPMLQVLKSMKADDRIILMSHLNDRAKDALYKTITHLLVSDTLPNNKKKLLHKKVGPLLQGGKRSLSASRKAVVQFGGAPMNYVLRTAVPLYLGLFAQ